jgi:hypothetical protein
MKIEQVKDKTSRSSELLDLARRLAEDAAELPVDSKERESLEKRAQQLVDEARALTETAKQEISKYK